MKSSSSDIMQSFSHIKSYPRKKIQTESKSRNSTIVRYTFVSTILHSCVGFHATNDHQQLFNDKIVRQKDW